MGDNDTQYRLPARQTGWLTLGCNQQDLWKTSERPHAYLQSSLGAGARAANTAQAHFYFFIQIAAVMN